MQKDTRITVLLMAVAEGAATRLAPVPPEGSPGCAYVTVAGRDARWIIAQKAPKVSLVSAFLMEVVADVSFLTAPKGRKGAQRTAKHTVVAKGAHLKGATRGRKEVRHIAKGMGAGKDVPLTLKAEFAQKVSMVELFFA